jgi:putative transposase
MHWHWRRTRCNERPIITWPAISTSYIRPGPVSTDEWDNGIEQQLITSLGSGRVTRVLERLIGERGRPEILRLDNGPEFTSRRMLGWAEDWKVGLVHIQPGRPMQNGHVESFHGRLRDECLNASWFRTLNHVRSTLASWRREYNCERPHSSLDYRTPEEFRQRAGYADLESRERFPHPHSLDYDG